MKLIPLVRLPVTFRPRILFLSALTVALIVLASLSGLIYPSSSSPLLVLSAIAALAALIVWCTKPAGALYTALILVFLPLGIIPANTHSVLNRSVTVIATVVWLVRLFGTRKRVVSTSSAVFMLIFVLWSSLTLLWAERTSPAMIAVQVYSLRFILFLLLIPNETNTKRELDGLMNTLAISGWVLMVSFVLTLLSEGYAIGSRLAIFGGNQNDAGVVALIALVGIMWQASRPSKEGRRLHASLAMAYLLLTFGLIALTGSRGSALSLGVTVTAFWLWKPLRRWGKLCFLIAALAFFLVPFVYTTLIQRFAVEAHDTVLGGREILWQAAWHVIEDHPLGGVGIGNAPYATLKYLEADPRTIALQRVVVHNPILTVWSETGIIGIVSYLGVLASALYSFAKKYMEFKISKYTHLMPYFAIVSSVTLGYMISWIKGGGMESDFSYFLVLALLTIPSVLDLQSFSLPSLTPEKPGNRD